MIAITAGHRGPGTGAVGFIDEGAETIFFRDKLAEELDKLNVKYIKDNDKETLSVLVKKLDKELSDNDVCLDIHFNSYINDLAHGSEIVIPLKSTQEEKDLANKLLNATCKTLGTFKRGIKTERQSAHGKLAMLSGFNCINLLAEICFVSNKKDAELYEKNKLKLIKEYAKILANFELTK